jgi:DNA repair exonuclease SbcCD nuclease subunit
VFYTGSLERTSFMEIVEPKGYLLIELEDDFVNVQFQKIKTTPMEVIELDITNEKQISKKIDQHFPLSNIRTQLRFFGRSLTEEEIRFMWTYLPAKEFPYLTFSPRIPTHKLRKLYGNYKEDFQFEAN